MDVGCKINKAMNGWFTSLVVEAINPTFAMVGSTLLSAPPPSMLARIQELSDHVRLVANALLGLFVLAGGVIVMSYGSVQTSTTVKEIAPRLVVATIMLNASLTICEYAIEFANALVAALLGQGVDGERAGNLLADKIYALIGDPQTFVLFLVMMVGAAVLMAIILAFMAVMRVALTLFLVIAAPLALLCHALPQTQGVARLWWRCFTGVLTIQVLQALVLILGFKVYLTDTTDAFSPPQTAGVLSAAQPTASRAIDIVILLGLLYILIRIPGWVARTIWQQAQPALLKRLIKAVIIYKTLGAARGILGKTRGGATGRAAKSATAHRHAGRPTRLRPPNGGPRQPGLNSGGTQPVHPPTSTGPNTPSGAVVASGTRGHRGPQQLALPLNLPPATKPAPTSSPGGSAAARRGQQMALAFPVTRVPRPPAAPASPSASGPWIRPRPPWVQDRLPGMPTRAPRPGQLRLRLDPPPRRVPRKGSQ